MDQFIIEKKNLYSDITDNFNFLIKNIENLNEDKINDKMVYQIKYIMENLKKLNDDIIDLNDNIKFNNFDFNENLLNRLDEQDNINKIINDLMPLYILKSLSLKNT